MHQVLRHLASAVSASPIALAASQAGSGGTVSGELVVGLPGFGGTFADAGAVVSLLGLGQSFGDGGPNIEINPPLDAGAQNPPASYGVALTSQSPGSGAGMTYSVPAGSLGSYYCGLRRDPNAGTALALNDILLSQIPSIAGQVTLLGQITWLPVGTFQANDAGVPQNYPSDAGPVGDGG